MRAIHSGNGVGSSVRSLSVVYISVGCSDADEFADSCKGLGWLDISISCVSANSEQLDSDEERLSDMMDAIRDSDLVIMRLHDSTAYFVKFERLLNRIDKAGTSLLVFSNLHTETSAYRSRFPFDETEYAKAIAYLEIGGRKNFTSLFLWGCSQIAAMDVQVPEPDIPSAQGIYLPGSEHGVKDRRYLSSLDPGTPTVGIVIGHWLWSKGDMDGVDRLIRSLEGRGTNVIPIYLRTVRSEVTGSIGITGCFRKYYMKGKTPRVDSIVMLSGFSQRVLEADGVNPFDILGVTALQSPMIYGSIEEWENDRSGMTSVEISVSAIQTEYDGQILIPPLYFKGRAGNSIRYEFSQNRISFIADAAHAWAKLHHQSRSDARIAFILNSSQHGSIGTAKGLSVMESLAKILNSMERKGYSIGDLPPDAHSVAAALNAVRTDCRNGVSVSEADYKEWFGCIPRLIRERISGHYGNSQDFISSGYRVEGIRGGNVFIGIEPNLDAEDSSIPSHQFVQFYMWIARKFCADVIVHIGDHSRLEWLDTGVNPLSSKSASDFLLGPIPRICLFPVDDPADATMAKRKCHSVIVSHLVPPTICCEKSDTIAELKDCLQTIMRVRMNGKSPDIDNLERARGYMDALNLWNDLSLRADISPAEIEREAPRILEYVTDIEERPVECGLHVLGSVPRGKRLDSTVQSAMRFWDDGKRTDAVAREMYVSETLVPALRSCSREIVALMDAIEGKYIVPGTSGSPYLGCHDMLPTGTNIHSSDLSRIPTEAAFETGREMAEEIISKSIKSNGEYPRNATIVLNGGTTLSNSGVEISCAMCLVGLRPIRNPKSGALMGIEPMDISDLGRPRVEVRICANRQVVSLLSPLLRKFEKGLESISMLDEEEITRSMRMDLNRNVASEIMSSMTGKGRISDNSPTDKGIVIMDAGSLQDDLVLETASQTLDDCPSQSFVLDVSVPGHPKVRSAHEEVSLIIRTKVLSPLWLDGLMKHGYDGTTHLVRLTGQMLCWGKMDGVTSPWMFDAVVGAFISDRGVREWILTHNPSALCTMLEDLSEAARLGYWVADEDRKKILRDLYLYAESVSEGFGMEDADA